MAEVATKTGLTGFLLTFECLPKLDKFLMCELHTGMTM